MNETKSLLQIKGIRDGLLISIDDASWEDQRAALIAQVDDQPAFFQGARLALDVATQVLHVNDLVELRDQLSERGIFLWAVVSESPTTENTAQLLGLATRVSKPRPEEQRPVPMEYEGEGTSLFLDRTLRSGTRIEFAGHVVVLGDVNPGAEIVAEGNIVVWGRLRGSVHAGIEGDKNVAICALDLSPTQLRIADYALELTNPRETSQPEIARVNEDDELKIELWSAR